VLTAGAEAQSEEKLFSPDKSYSVEIVRNTENFLLLSKRGKTFQGNQMMHCGMSLMKRHRRT